MQLATELRGQRIKSGFRANNRFIGELRYETEAWQWSGHLTATIPIGVKTTLTGGSRFTYIPARNQAYTEPRLSLRYDQPTSPLGPLGVRLSGGIYRQYVTQADITSAEPTSIVPSLRFWLPLDASVAPPRAYHAAAEAFLRPSNAWSVQIGTYYKWHPRFHHVDYTGLVARLTDMAPRLLTAQSTVLAAGQGRALGANLRVRRDGARLTSGVTLGVHAAERRYDKRFGERWIPAPWEEPVRLSAHTEVTVAEGLRVRADWEGAWGRSWSLRRIYYDYIGPSGALGPAVSDALRTPSEQMLGPSYRLNLSVRAVRSWRGVTIEG